MSGTSATWTALSDVPDPNLHPRYRPRSHFRTFGWAVVLIVTVVLVGWAGWLLNMATHPAHDVTVTRVFGGTVATVNIYGNAGCIQPAGGGPTVCSGFYVDRGLPKLRLGQQVHAAFENSRDSGTLLLIYPSS